MAVAAIDLSVIVPASEDARDRGCVCPSPEDCGSPTFPAVVLSCGGPLFDPLCPVHGRAVTAEVQRMIGARQ